MLRHVQILCFLLIAGAVLPAQISRSTQLLEKQLSVEVDGAPLPATLTLASQHQTKLPLVLLMSPAGPLDSEQPESTNQLFRELARALAESGIASLRYGERGTSAATAEADARSSPRVQLSHALALLRYANGVLDLDSSAQFVLGYDFAGTLAPYVAEKAGARGIILLAPQVAPLEQALAEQTRRKLDGEEKPETAIRQALDSQNQILSDVRAGKIPASRMINGAPASYWLDWMNRNPGLELKKAGIPALILQGGRDDQVSEDDYEKFQKQMGQESDVEFRWLPTLGHSFLAQPASSTPGPANPARISSNVVTSIADWVKRHRPSPGSR